MIDGNEEHITSLNYADGLIRKLKEENKNLLSIIEQAEKALQSIVDYPNIEMESPEDLGYTYQTMAEEALQAIRK